MAKTHPPQIRKPNRERREEPQHQKRAKSSRKKRFGIEINLRFRTEWHLWKWYDTEEKRDQALNDLFVHQSNIWKEQEDRPKYRPVNR